MRKQTLPVQFPVMPSPLNPGLHEQEKLPTRFVHSAFSSQLCEFSAHSSMSVQQPMN